MTGLKRNLEEKIDRLLHIFPVVLITGARQVGYFENSGALSMMIVIEKTDLY